MTDPNPTDGVDYKTWWSGQDLMVTKQLVTTKTQTAFMTREPTVVIGDGHNRPIAIPASKVTELIELLTQARDWNGPI